MLVAFGNNNEELHKPGCLRYENYKEKDEWIEGQTGRQTGRQTDRWTN